MKGGRVFLEQDGVVGAKFPQKPIVEFVMRKRVTALVATIYTAAVAGVDILRCVV